MFSEETDWLHRFRAAGWQVWFSPSAEVVHLGGASHGGRLYAENLRGILRYLTKYRGPRYAERARLLLLWSLRLRALVLAGRALPGRRAAAGIGERPGAPRPMIGRVPVRLAARDRDRAAPGIPGGVGARPARHGARARLGLREPLRRVGRRVRCCTPRSRSRSGSSPRSGSPPSSRCSGAPPRPGGPGTRCRCGSAGRAAGVFAAGVALGLALWHVEGAVVGDALFHEARVRKLVELSHLHLRSVDELAHGGLHPGYAFPLWHGFLALVVEGLRARSRGRRPPRGLGARAARASCSHGRRAWPSSAPRGAGSACSPPRRRSIASLPATGARTSRSRSRPPPRGS